MNGYDKLAIVDRYEESHDNPAAVRRACDVMAEYLANLKRPLPDVASQAVEAALEFRKGSTGVDALRDADDQISRFLKQARHDDEFDIGSISVVRASGALLKLLQVPTWGGGASEALSNFLEWVDEFEQNHSLFEQLLDQSFGPSRSAP
jgi:hypothetical protein